MTTDERNWCRCPSPLPPKTAPHTWTCSACGGERRYHESLRIQKGACVSQCGECRYDAEQRGERAPQTLVRFVVSTRQLAGDFRDSNTYLMCDPCIDAEITRQSTADVFDGRPAKVGAA